MKSTTPQIIMNSQYILHYDVTQPTNWPTDQPTSISFTMMLHNQLTDQPTSISFTMMLHNLYQLIDRLTNQPVYPSLWCYTTNWLTNQPTNQPTSISFSSLWYYTTNRLTDQPTNQYILHNDITQPTDWPANQPTNQPTNPINKM
jgi:hypothetical protein